MGAFDLLVVADISLRRTTENLTAVLGVASENLAQNLQHTPE
jgi:hypothetical protein